MNLSAYYVLCIRRQRTRKCTVDSVFLERLTAVLVEAVDLVERADELVSRRQQREGHAAAQLPRGRAAAARQAPRVALALRAVAAAALRDTHCWLGYGYSHRHYLY